MAANLRLSQEGNDVFDAPILPMDNVEGVRNLLDSRVSSLRHKEEGDEDAREDQVEAEQDEDDFAEVAHFVLMELELLGLLGLKEFERGGDFLVLALVMRVLILFGFLLDFLFA